MRDGGAGLNAFLEDFTQWAEQASQAGCSSSQDGSEGAADWWEGPAGSPPQLPPAWLARNAAGQLLGGDAEAPEEQRLPPGALLERLHLARQGAAKWKGRCQQLVQRLRRLNAQLQQARLAAAADDAAHILLGDPSDDDGSRLQVRALGIITNQSIQGRFICAAPWRICNC